MRGPEAGRGIPVNTRIYTGGIRIDTVAKPYTPRAMAPHTTADHEAIHAALGDTEHVTIVPGPGYNGLTRLRRGNAMAALGPHAMGAHGTSWDVAVAARMGHSVGLGAVQAEVIRNHAEVVEIADALVLSGSLNGEAVDHAKQRAKRKRRHGVSATVSIRSEDGQERVFEDIKISNEGTVMIPGEWMTLPSKPKEKINRENLELAA